MMNSKCQIHKLYPSITCNEPELCEGYCIQHGNEYMNLVVAESTLKGAGNGLFVGTSQIFDKKFFSGDIICVYKGELLTIEDVNNRYGTNEGEYLFQLNATDDYDANVGNDPRRIIDAKDLKSCYARYINSVSNHDMTKPNVEFMQIGNEVVIVAIRDIVNGEEILVSYGVGSGYGFVELQSDDNYQNTIDDITNDNDSQNTFSTTYDTVTNDSEMADAFGRLCLKLN